MKQRILGAMAALVIMMAASPAFALGLHEARAAGILGEKKDGYVAVLKKSADADALANDVNDKRRQEYARISKEKGQPVDVVATLAAEQIINTLGKGEQYQDAGGSWKTHP
jgi:uncharacterized protein YdbL (DUF1318 family)